MSQCSGYFFLIAFKMFVSKDCCKRSVGKKNPTNPFQICFYCMIISIFVFTVPNLPFRCYPILHLRTRFVNTSL